MRRTGQWNSLTERRQTEHYPSLDWPVIAMAKAFSAETRTGSHSHDRAQLLFATKGLMVADTSAGTWLVPRGHALWMPAGLTHDVSMHGAVSMRTAYIRAAEAARLPLTCRVLKVGPLLEAVLAALAETSSEVGCTARTDHLIWLVLDEIDRAPSTTLALPLPNDTRLARLAHALMADPGSTLTVDGWCEVVGLSRRTMTRQFRSQVGMSFGDWRRRLRLLSAARRVADEEPLAKVAASLDYQKNVAAFRTMARRDFGDAFPELAARAS